MYKNNLFKKMFLLYLIAVFTLSSTLTSFAATPTDVIGTVYKEPVSALVELSIVGKPKNFNPHKNITKALVSVYIVNMLGLGNQVKAKRNLKKFTDITPKYWAAGHINLLAEKSILSGTKGKFMPESPISYRELLIALLKSLGYGSEIEGNGKSPDEYLIVSDQIGLIGNVKWKNANDKVSNGNAATLIWNALNCVYEPTGNTLLEEKFPKYYKAHRKEKTYEELAKLKECVAFINTYDSPECTEEISYGSGVVVWPGSILTNAHVIEFSPRFGINYNETNADEKFNTSGVQFYDPDYDVAIIDSPETSYRKMDFGDSDELKVGQKIVAISSPEGISYKNTVSDGIISGFREIDGHKYIQITAAVSSGSSGGAIFNMYGELVGIITLKNFNGESLNLAIPINEVLKALADTSVYNLDLNIELTDNIRFFEYNKTPFWASCTAFYSEEKDEYRVNYYLYDDNENSKKFIELFTSDKNFKKYVQSFLNESGKLCEEAKYKNYLINLAVNDRNYIVRKSDGKTEVIKDTFSSPPPKKVDYEDFSKSLWSKYSYASLDNFSFNLEELNLSQSLYNNILYLNFVVSESTYNNISQYVTSANKKKALEDWISGISQDVMKQYPDKTLVSANVYYRVGSFDDYKEEYSKEPYDQTYDYETAKYYVCKDLMYLHTTIYNDIMPSWSISETK